MPFDKLIHNGTLVTVNAGFSILHDGVIGITDGRIQEIRPRNPEAVLPEAFETIDAKGGIVMPGLVNTHTHLPMTLFRGLADDLPLDRWLYDHIFPAERAHIDPETVFQGGMLGCAEMIFSGITTFCDGYFLEDKVAEAVLAAGLRAVLGQGVVDFPAPGVPDPAENIRTAARFLDGWRDRSPRITPSVFCHSPYTCSEKTLRNAKAAAGNTLFQIHVAETQEERDRIRAEKGEPPVAHLDRLGILDHRTLLVHANWLDEAEIRTIFERGSAVSHNPESNMKLASGVAPLDRLVSAGVRAGLGTDGVASNNRMDLFRTMDLTAKLHKVHALDPTALPAQEAIRLATIGGAETLGLGDRIGSLEPGKEADIIILAADRPHLTPLHHPESQIVYAAKGTDVRHVLVAGRCLMRERKLVTLDVEGIMGQIRVTAGRIAAGMEGDRS